MADVKCSISDVSNCAYDTHTHTRMFELSLFSLSDHLEKMGALSIDFSKHLGEEKTELGFTAAQLEGLPADFVEGLDKFPGGAQEGGLLTVTLKYPHVVPISKYCKVAETRRVVMSAFNSRCADTNVAILEELVLRRAAVAKILGFDSHSDYVLDVRMAKSAAAVQVGRNNAENLRGTMQRSFEYRHPTPSIVPEYSKTIEYVMV